MASSAATACSPSCPQLRLAFNSRGSLLARTTKLDCKNLRLLCAAQYGRLWSGDIRRSSSSLAPVVVVSASTKDNSFAGWSDSATMEEEKEGGSKSSEGNNWFGGNVAAGAAAGLVLVAGVTLAGLAVSNRSTSSRREQQMEPLTPQQEVILSSEKEEDGTEEETHEKIDENELDDLKEDIAQLTELDEGSSGDRDMLVNGDQLPPPADIGNVGITAAIVHASVDDDELTVGDESVAPEMNSSSSTMQSLSEAVDTLSVAVDKLDTESDSLNSKIEELVDLSAALQFEENSISLSSSSTVVEESSELKDASVPETPLVDTTLESTEVTEDGMEDVVPKENEEVTSSLEVDYLQENVSAEASLPPPSPSMNEQETTVNEMDESSSPTTLSPFLPVGIPAPSAVFEALRVPPGKVLVPAVVDQGQGQALAALQVLKVIEAEAQPGDLCSRREYARWLVSASGALSRNSVSKVYPAMYIENVSELAFDDITPDDPDFSSIQGLAESGLISSKLSSRDLQSVSDDEQGPFYFSPESPLSRQDLVSWKMALEKRQLPEADKKILYQVSGFRDIDRIHPDAWPSLVADLSAGDQGIISLAFGCTRLFQPDKPVTKAQAAIALALGEASDVVSEELARIEAESMAENAVSAHNALVAEVERDINAGFEKELSIEREKINAVQKMAEEASSELAALRAQREEDNIALMKERAAIEAEMEVLSRIRHEMEQQLQNLLTDKVEISYEKERISKLQKQAEEEKEEVSRLQLELEVERRALSMARAWAEDEAKRAREQAKALEEARDKWEKQGIKVLVDGDLQQEQSSAEATWAAGAATTEDQLSVQQTVDRAETLTDKLKLFSEQVTGKSKEIINTIIQKILAFVSALKAWASETGSQAEQVKDATLEKARESIQGYQKKAVEVSNAVKDKASGSIQEMQQTTAGVGSAVKDGVKRVAGDCRDGVEKLTQRFKS
ncbi:hypothetical protein LINGRAHAP2_LOCUS17144 [Linum grandiflorum]